MLYTGLMAARQFANRGLIYFLWYKIRAHLTNGYRYLTSKLIARAFCPKKDLSFDLPIKSSPNME